MELSGKRIMLIGGAGLVGSHIVDQLIDEPVAEIVVLDNFVRGTRENLAEALTPKARESSRAAMTDRDAAAATDEGRRRRVPSRSALAPQCSRAAQRVGREHLGHVQRGRGVPAAASSGSSTRRPHRSTATRVVDADDRGAPVQQPHLLRRDQNRQRADAAAPIYEQHKLPYVGLRYMNIYGPRQDYEGAYVSVIMKVLDRIDAGSAAWSSATAARSTTSSTSADSRGRTSSAMKADCADEFFNVGTGIGTSINELAEMLLELTGSSLPIDYRPQAQSFVTHRIGSTEKAEKAARLQGDDSAAEGLQSTWSTGGWRSAQVGSRSVNARRCAPLSVSRIFNGAPAEHASLQRMTDAVAHRGPDGEGHYRRRRGRAWPPPARDHRPLACRPPADGDATTAASS